MLVDPCVGNDKARPIPFWNEMSWPFLERFADAGFDVDVDRHGRAHAPARGPRRLGHAPGRRRVGADVHERPAPLHRARARVLPRAATTRGPQGVYDDSVAPVIAAGLSEIVAEDADLGRRAAARADDRAHARSRLAVDRVRGRARARSPATSCTTRCSARSRSGPRSATSTSTRRGETRRRMLAQAATTGALDARHALHRLARPAASSPTATSGGSNPSPDAQRGGSSALEAGRCLVAAAGHLGEQPGELHRLPVAEVRRDDLDSRPGARPGCGRPGAPRTGGPTTPMSPVQLTSSRYGCSLAVDRHRPGQEVALPGCAGTPGTGSTGQSSAS